MTEEYIVEVDHLHKSFQGKPAVIDVSLKVKRGEIFGFLGPNGSGKTTTIRMMCGLMTPDSGSGNCLGYDILRDSRMIKRLVGYVPQTFSLYQDLTVKENLIFICRLYGHYDIKDRVEKILERLQLERYQNVLAARLSGGWKQRLSLAAALIHEPKLLLLDEPTAGVDPKARRDFWNDISELSAQGISSLVSTHYMDEAERCNRVAYIAYGRLMTEGTIEQIIKEAGLITWSASGSQLGQLQEKVQSQNGVLQVVAWGNDLRICGVDAGLLQTVVQANPHYQWHQVPSSLEEIFIHLLGKRAAELKNDRLE